MEYLKDAFRVGVALIAFPEEAFCVRNNRFPESYNIK